MIIDCHGHYTTAPAGLGTWRELQLYGSEDFSSKPEISDQEIRDSLDNNVFFDTWVCHRPGIELLLKLTPADNILFASEVVGAVRGIDPETGPHYDDTRRYVDSIDWLSAADRRKIYEGNAHRVYPRAAAKLQRPET